jgi:hypothetical protein
MKILAYFLIVVLLINMTSCYSYTSLSGKYEFIIHQGKKNVSINYLQMKNNSMVYFNKAMPGTLKNNEVIGQKYLLLNELDPDTLLFNKNNKIKFAVKDSIEYKVIYQNDTLITCDSIVNVRIPFSEIKSIHLKEMNEQKTLGLILLTIGAVAAAGLIYLWLSNMTFDLDMSM